MGIKLSISNIAWSSEYDQQVYKYMFKAGFKGIEIAPTRIFPKMPYEKKEEASKFAKKLYVKYGLKVCSMQSIWYGRNEKIFGSKEERVALLEYTRKAIDFAESIDARNLVFGCPKNRCIEKQEDRKIAVEFFRVLGNYAAEHKTVLAMEANPVIYGTNFINKTSEAIKLIQEVDSKGFKMNLDFGTIIYNEEKIISLRPFANYINHVHISEPDLKLIIQRKEHKELMELLRDEKYDGYVSIEMGKCEDIQDVLKTIDYVATL